MRQQPTFYRLDRPVAGSGGRERPDGGGGGQSMMIPLPPGWVCLQDCNLSGQLNQPVVVPFVLMHPYVGVALIDVSPIANPEAELILRRRLEAARFASIFPGFLPILHLRLDRADLPSTEAILRDAFAALPPLSVPGGDGWVSVVRRALLPRDPTRAAAHPGLSAEQAHQRFPRPAEPARSTEPEGATADLFRREAPAHGAAASAFPGADMPEPPLQRALPLPWIILSGVGGLIAVLAVVGLFNGAPDTWNAAEDAARQPAREAPPPAAPSLAAVPAMPSPKSAALAPASPTPATPAPKSMASLPPPPALPPAAAPVAPFANSGTGASATPAPAQRPAATAADRLPRVTVRQPANLRTGPSDQANVLRVVPRGETLRVHGRTPNGWLQVGDAEPRGWLHTSRLSDTE